MTAIRHVIIAVLALGATTTGHATAPDRRVVDVAEVGNAPSEDAHGYAGHDVIDGAVDGKAYRQANGWMHFALNTYEDTEVTVACTFVGVDTVSRSYDLVVEDSAIVTRTVSLQPGASTVIEAIVPFSLTRGKTHIAVVLRARNGLTPALRELRTIQDHQEVDFLQTLHGVAR